MKTTSMLVAALAAAPAAFAHTVWSVFYVDGVSQGDGVALRMRKDGSKASYPLEDFASNDMACNVDGTTGVSRVQPVSDGATLTFEMRSWPNDPSKESIAEGHKGPCAVYLKKVDNAVNDKGAGDGWFKLFDDGYDASTDQWCVDRLRANNGRLSVKLPEGLQGGDYLARPEVVALHNATEGGAQFYTGCAQIHLSSTGTLVPAETVAIPGYVKAGEPSVKFNIYINKDYEYTTPGPAVAKLVPGGSASETAQQNGLKPAGCIVENGNWCGFEVSSYTDEKGCWAAGEECWKQSQSCWDTTSPTGGAGCEIFANKCKAIQETCKAKQFPGPPQKDQDLTPKKATINIGSVMPTSGGGVIESAAKTTTTASEASSSKVEAQATTPMTEPTKLAEASSEYEAATPTTAAPVLDQAPAPTEKAVCPPGYQCVTKFTTHVVTQTKYVTVEVDGYRKRRA